MGSSGPPRRNVPLLEIVRSEHEGVRVVALSGELDLRSIADLELALEEAADGDRARVCVDLRALQFIDSTGLATLVRRHQQAQVAGGAVAVVCPAGPVRRTIQITGLMALLTVLETFDEALDALGGQH